MRQSKKCYVFRIVKLNNRRYILREDDNFMELVSNDRYTAIWTILVRDAIFVKTFLGRCNTTWTGVSRKAVIQTLVLNRSNFNSFEIGQAISSRTKLVF